MVDAIDPLGLRSWVGVPSPMARAHLHADVELNFALAGRAEYLLGGVRTVVPPMRLAALWAAIPHQLVAAPGVRRMYWLTVPLERVLAWRLPAGFTAALFAGRLVIAGDAALGRSDALCLPRWAAEWDAGPARRAQAVGEIAQRLRRLALDWQDANPDAGGRGDDGHAAILVRVARVVAERYREPVGVAAIAHAVGVHPKYLSTAFRRQCGMGVHEYLTRMRLGHAQHLLRTTQRAVTTIAFDSGFGSLNAFYSAFRSQLGTTPSALRSADADVGAFADG